MRLWVRVRNEETGNNTRSGGGNNSTVVVVVAVVAVAVVAPAVVVVIVVVVVVGLGFKHGEQRRHGMLRERENETTVLCVHRECTCRMKITLCGERIDEIYYILCVLKCILEKVVVAPFFIFIVKWF